MNGMIDLDQIQKDRSLSGKFSRTAGKAVRFREECEFARQIVMDNKDLQLCTPDSMKSALLTVAALGLSVNRVSQYAYLTPRNICVERNDQGKATRWEKQVVLIPGYRGLLKLADDSGAISHISAECVYERDFFDLELGSSPKLTHKPFIMGNRGAILGAYCVTTLPGGDKQITWVPEEDLLKIRAAAETTKVWDKWPDRMRIKSAIRRAYTQWPKALHTPAMNHAMDLLNSYEGEKVESEKDVEPITDEQVKALELIGADFGFDMGYGLDRVLKAYGVQTPASLPADVYTEAKGRLSSFCEAAQAKRQEKESDPA